MKTVATVMQLTRGLLILTPAEYDKPEGGLSINKKRSGGMPTNFSVPQIFELNDSLKDHPYEKSDELAAFVKRCAESVSVDLGDIFLCIEDEDVLITKEYKHAVSKEKLLPTFARVEAEAVLHQDVEKYTILNFEYGQQYGKANKSEEVSASLFAMNTGLLTDIRANFSQAGLKIVKVTPPIAGMLYTSKVDLNSATRAIAVISMDFAATRLVVLQNGAPVFQQSFSSVLEDIAELLMLEFGISKLGAIDLIRQDGLGVCNKCNSPSTRKQTMTMLDNAAGEILRNLRMVISTMRLDIDQIVLCDALAKLPNISAYCRQVGLTAPMENVMRIFSGSSVAPTASQSAVSKGYDAASFITLNGILTMPLNEANLLQGESNILSAMAKQGGSKIGNLAAGLLGVIAAVWIVGITGWWIALEVQKNADTTALANPEFQRAEQLIKDEKEYKDSIKNLDIDLKTLPQTEYKSSILMTHVFDEVVRKSEATSEFKTSKDAATEKTIVNISFQTKDYQAFVDLKNEINDAGFFAVDTNLSSDRQERSDGTTSSSYYVNRVKLIMTDKGLEECALTEAELAAREAANKGETPSTNPGTTTKTEIPTDAKVDEALVGTWEFNQDGLVMTYEFKNDGTGNVTLVGSPVAIKWGTKDGKVYMNGDPIKQADGTTTSVSGEGTYKVDGTKLTLEVNGQSVQLNKK